MRRLHAHSLKPEDARRCATVCNPNGRWASRGQCGRPAQGREGLKAHDHSRSMATGTDPDVRKWRGRQHAEQATHAIRHCNQNTLAGKLKGIQRGEEVGGWTRVTKRRAVLRKTCQSRGAQVIGGGWTNRNGWRGA
jgi:hypothetical protein